MKNFSLLPSVLVLTCMGAGTAVAQMNADGTSSPPKVMVITREYLKPGRSGSMHVKTESAFVRAEAAAKWPVHYFAMDSLSGLPRSLFFTPYPSMEAWAKDMENVAHNATLSAALDHAMLADGDLLTSLQTSAFAFREDMSIRPSVKIEQMHYMDIAHFRIRPGHTKEWEDLIKLYQHGYEQADPNLHVAVFEQIYGTDSDGSFLIITPMENAAEVDHGLDTSKEFVKVMGEEGMAKIRDLTKSCIASSEDNLFVMNPKMSYAPDAWVNANPSFWKSAATAEPKPKTAKATDAKPAQ